MHKIQINIISRNINYSFKLYILLFIVSLLYKNEQFFRSKSCFIDGIKFLSNYNKYCPNFDKSKIKLLVFYFISLFKKNFS